MADSVGGLTPEERSLIKGGQANLWTEFVPDEPTAWWDTVYLIFLFFYFFILVMVAPLRVVKPTYGPSLCLTS